jgi:hypothetical protein
MLKPNIVDLARSNYDSRAPERTSVGSAQSANAALMTFNPTSITDHVAPA